MLNVIFYKPAETKSQSYKVYDENGNLVVVTTTEIYHPIRDFACETMTSAKGLLSYEEHFDGFSGSMESLSNAESLFEGTPIKFVQGEDEEEMADFSSVTICKNMFAGCEELESVKINFDSLMNGSAMFDGMDTLKTVEMKLGSLKVGDKMFKGTSISSFDTEMPVLESANEMFYEITPSESTFTFKSNAPSLRYAHAMFKGIPMTSFECDLTSLEDGSDMFNGIILPADTNFIFKSNTPSLKNASGMFKGVKMSDLSGIVPNALEDASEMFYGNDSISSLVFKTPKLKKATSMFENCNYLHQFEGDLSSLEEMDKMFKFAGSKVNGVYGLTVLKVPSLENVKTAREAFFRSSFQNWNINLSSLEDGTGMFQHSSFLKSFTSDLSALKSGSNMFKDCPLNSFRASLSSLENAVDMFDKSKLDAESVMYIIDSLPSYESGEHNITIGINCVNNQSELDTFASDAYYQSWEILNNYITNKGWTVIWKDSSNNTISL